MGWPIEPPAGDDHVIGPGRFAVRGDEAADVVAARHADHLDVGGADGVVRERLLLQIHVGAHEVRQPLTEDPQLEAAGVGGATRRRLDASERGHRERACREHETQYEHHGHDEHHS